MQRKGRGGVPSTIIFAMSANNSGVIPTLSSLLDERCALSMAEIRPGRVSHALESTIGTASPPGARVDVPEQTQGLAESIGSRSNRDVCPVRGKVRLTVRE